LVLVLNFSKTLLHFRAEQGPLRIITGRIFFDLFYNYEVESSIVDVLQQQYITKSY